MNGFVLRDFLIELIGVLDRTVFYTGSAASAYALVNIPGLLSQRYIEVPCFTNYTIDLSIGEDFYICVPVDLDQLRGEYSH